MQYRPSSHSPLSSRRFHLLVVTGITALAVIVGSCAQQGENIQASKTSANVQRVPPDWRPFNEPTAACGSGEATADGAARIDRNPYLQQVVASGAKILFTADTDQPIAVDVRKPGQEPVAVLSRVEPTKYLTSRFQHVVDLEGLEPGTLYCYALRLSDTPLTEPIGFTTAPVAGEEAPLHFGVFGDSGYGSDGQYAVLDRMTNVSLDLVLVTGDVAYESGTLSQFERNFFDVYEPLLGSVPFYPVAGNHDYETDGGGPFREVFALPDVGDQANNERWYSFDRGDVHFVAIDTERLDDAQIKWLTRDLSAKEYGWIFVMTHDGPYSSGNHGSNMTFRDKVVPILEQYGVDVVFSGHDHHYERSKPMNGITYVVTGGGGRGTRGTGSSSFTDFSEAVLHFVHVTVDGDTATIRAIDGTGQLFDAAVIER